MESRNSLESSLKRAWSPPPDLTVSQWADKERRLSSESSAEPGQWRTNRAEYQRGMMDAANNPSVSTLVLMTSAQIGKTELVNNVVGFFMSHDPAPMLVLQPTLEMAETWSKDRLTPMLRDTPALQGKVNTKSRNSDNNILYKKFPGGHVTMAGANSPASLASRPVRLVLCDEVDRYPASAGEEGDPVSLAEKRTETFWNSLLILTSTPTIKGVSRVEAEFNESDQRYYHCPCPHCGEYQRLEWKRIIFDKDDLTSVHYACVNGCVVEEKHKPWMIKNGEWVATAEFKGIAGFHLSAIYSPWKRWGKLVSDFLKASKSPETLKTFVNTSLGETWEEKGAGADSELLQNRREAYDVDSLPDDILVITAGVDVQGDRLEALSQGWGEDRERWNIEHKIFWGDPEKSAVWEELDEWLLKTYQVAGRGLKAACCLVDSGYKQDSVTRFTKSRQTRRVFASKGSNQYYSALVSGPSQVGKSRALQYRLGTDTAKDSIVLSSLEITEPGENCIHFPDDFDDELFNQLGAEERRTKYRKGQAYFEWVSTRERNECLDLHVYNLCALIVLDPDLAKIRKKRKPKPAEKPEPPLQPLKAPSRKPRRKRNWATDL